MTVPKHRISKSRRDKRRTHWKLSSPGWVECSHCHQPTLPHRACPHCGHYHGREVVSPKEK